MNSFHLKDLINCYSNYWPIITKKRNNCKVRWHGSGGRTSNGRVLTHTKSSFFVKRKLIKIGITPLTIKSPFFILKSYKKVLKRNYNLIMLSGCITSTVPSSTTGFVGELLHKNTYDWLKKSFYYNTVCGFSYGKQVSYVSYKNFFLASSLGSFCTIVFSYLNNYVIVLPSGYLKVVNSNSMAIDSDPSDVQFRKFKKGARLLLLRGRKSTVRGVAKNPNDHPHGGRTNTVLRPKTPWGVNIRKSKIDKKIVHNSKLKQKDSSVKIVEHFNVD